jgi:hypothetical protein
LGKFLAVAAIAMHSGLCCNKVRAFASLNSSERFGNVHDIVFIVGEFPRGVALLDHLHHHVSSLRVEDAAGRIQDLVTWFLVKACSPLLDVLSDLVSAGRVDEVTDPFVRFRSALSTCRWITC